MHLSTRRITRYTLWVNEDWTVLHKRTNTDCDIKLSYDDVIDQFAVKNRRLDSAHKQSSPSGVASFDTLFN